MNLTKELENAGYKAVVMPVEVGARGFVGSSVYDLLTKLSICGNKRTKALKLLAEIAENSSRWIWSRRNERFLHKDKKCSNHRRTSWRSGIAPGSAIHQEMRVCVRILALCKKKKKKKKDNRETPGSHDLGVARPP